MIRNTGFFRGIDCPFYTEPGLGRDGRNACNRPYCHFRHSNNRRPSYGAQADGKKLKDLQPAQNGTEHDVCIAYRGYLFIYWVSMSANANRKRCRHSWFLLLAAIRLNMRICFLLVSTYTHCVRQKLTKHFFLTVLSEWRNLEHHLNKTRKQ